MTTKRHYAIAIPETIADLSDGFLVGIRIKSIEPSMPAREGKSFEIRVPASTIMSVFGLRDMTDETLLDNVIGVSRHVTFNSEEVDGKLVTTDFRLLGKVLTLRDKEVRETKIAAEAAKKNPPVVEKIEPKTEAEMKVELDGVKPETRDGHPACVYCDSGKALVQGANCGECWRHMINAEEGVVIIVPENERGAAAEVLVAS